MSTTKLKNKAIEILKREFFYKQTSMSMNEFFELLLSAFISIPNKGIDINKDYSFIANKNDTLSCLIYTYFLYFKPFISFIQNVHPLKYKDVLFKIAEVLKYKSHKVNEIIMQYGDKGDQCYIILKGSVDVIFLNEKQVSMTKLDYLRYLGYLIGYKEYAIFNRVINANMEHCPLYITDFIGSYKFNKPSKGLSPQLIELKDLYDVLTKEEQAILNQGFNDNDNDNCTQNKAITTITALDYVNRMKQYHSKDSMGQAKLIPKKWDNETLIEFTICEYILMTSLTAGQLFGCLALSDYTNKRNSTVITSTECHLGCMSREHYDLILKGIYEQSRKDNMSFIISSYVFKDIHPSFIQRKYFNYFVLHNVSKGHKVFMQHDTGVNDIFFLRRGLYEISAYMSYEKLLALINYLHSMIKKPSSKYTEREYELAVMINQMNELNKRIVARAKDVKALNDFCRLNENYLISVLNAPDIIGFKDLYYNPNDSGTGESLLYTFKLKSLDGEYFSISKEIYSQMYSQEPHMLINESKYVNMKIKKMIRRLLFVQSSKLEIYFRHNPDNIYFKEYASKDNVDPMENILQVDHSFHKELRPKSIFNCYSTNNIGNLKRNSIISVNKDNNKEKSNQKTLNSNKTSMANMLQYQSLSKLNVAQMSNKTSPKYNSNANSRLSTGNWVKTRNGNNYQTLNLSKSHSIMTLLKGTRSNYNKTRATQAIGTVSAFNHNERKSIIIPMFSSSNDSSNKTNSHHHIKNKYISSLYKKRKATSLERTIDKDKEKSRSIYLNKENKETQSNQPLHCNLFDCSLSSPPLLTQYNTPSISILENILNKKERYIDTSQQNSLKKTRNFVVRFQSQFSIGKKLINVSKKRKKTLNNTHK